MLNQLLTKKEQYLLQMYVYQEQITMPNWSAFATNQKIPYRTICYYLESYQFSNSQTSQAYFYSLMQNNTTYQLLLDCLLHPLAPKKERLERLFISNSTFQRHVLKMNAFLAHYDLFYSVKHYPFLHGSEQQIRLLTFLLLCFDDPVFSNEGYRDRLDEVWQLRQMHGFYLPNKNSFGEYNPSFLLEDKGLFFFWDACTRGEFKFPKETTESYHFLQNSPYFFSSQQMTKLIFLHLSCQEFKGSLLLAPYFQKNSIQSKQLHQTLKQQLWNYQVLSHEHPELPAIYEHFFENSSQEFPLVAESLPISYNSSGGMI